MRKLANVLILRKKLFFTLIVLKIKFSKATILKATYFVLVEFNRLSNTLYDASLGMKLMLGVITFSRVYPSLPLL